MYIRYQQVNDLYKLVISAKAGRQGCRNIGLAGVGIWINKLQET